MNLAISHLLSCILPHHLFSAYCLVLLSPLPLLALLSHLTPIYLPFPPSSPVTLYLLLGSFLPPFSLSGPIPCFFFLGWRWNLGDQWREYERHETCTSYRTNQEWRPARPSGAQEGWRLGAWIWWVNLRKHSLLTHLHALSLGTPSGRWWVEEGRTILPSQDPLPIPETNPPGRGLMVLSFFLVEGCAGLWFFCLFVCLLIGGGGAAGAAPVGAVASSCSPALSFHVIPLSLFTFWPLSKSTLELYRKVVGLFKCFLWQPKLVWLTRIVKSVSLVGKKYYWGLEILTQH